MIHPIPDTWNAFFRVKFYITEKFTNDFSVIWNFPLKTCSMYPESGVFCYDFVCKLQGASKCLFLVCSKPYNLRSHNFRTLGQQNITNKVTPQIVIKEEEYQKTHSLNLVIMFYFMTSSMILNRVVG